MERYTKAVLTNMCMIEDNQGNVLVEDKIVGNSHGLILPGGHVEKHESIVDSTIREVYEETGLKVSDLQFCGMKDWIEKDGSRYLVFLYKTNTFTGTLKSSSEGNVFWMAKEELKKQPLLWHLNDMLEIFDGKNSELFFNPQDGKPILK